MSSATIKPSRPSITPDEALRIARTDAERAYGDLSAYSIAISLHSDGWHIDYDIADPAIKGGGPHYVIDRYDGGILGKRYDQ